MASAVICTNWKNYYFTKGNDTISFVKQGLMDSTSTINRLQVAIVYDTLSTADIMELVFNNTSYIFEFGTHDALNPLLIDEYSIYSGDVYGWITTLAKQVQAHPIINEYFVVEPIMDVSLSGQAYLGFTPRGIGAAYNISLGASSTPSVVYEFSINPGVDGVSPIDYGLMLRINLKTDRHYDEKTYIYELFATGIENKLEDYIQIDFKDINKTIASALAYDRPEDYIEPKPHRTAYGIMDIEVWETWGNGLYNKIQFERTGDFEDSMGTDALVICGGYELKNINENIAKKLSLNGYEALTSDVYNRIITPEQPLFLSFLYFENEYGTATVNIKVKYSDGTSITYSMNIDCLDKWIYQTPCGIKQLKLDEIDPSKTIISLEVHIEQGASLSKMYTYSVEYAYSDYSKYLLYQNPYGATDSIRCDSIAEKTAERKMQTYEHAISKNTRTYRPTLEVLYTDIQKKYKFSTGYLPSKEDIQLYQEILTADAIQWFSGVYKYDEYDGLLYTNRYHQDTKDLVLLSETIQYPSDDAFVYDLSFDLAEATKNRVLQADSRIDELYHDECIEFIVRANDTDADLVIDIDAVYANMNINNKAIDLSSAGGNYTLDLENNKTYYVKMQWRKATSLSIAIDRGIAEFVLIKYRSFFGNLFILDYLYSRTGSLLNRRFATMYHLYDIRFTNGIYQKDEVLLNLRKCFYTSRVTYQMDLSGSGSSITDNEIADELAMQGVAISI